MPHQVWGTFSVSDHLRKRPFVGEVLLYDKLVIPVIPEGDEQVRDRWIERGWRPDIQDKCLDALSRASTDLVWPVPWDLQKNEQFKSRMDVYRGAASDVRDLQESRKVDPDRPAYYVTRRILEDLVKELENTRDLPPGVWVEPMAAYSSYRDFEGELSLSVDRKVPVSAKSGLAGVFGWQFMVPEESRMSDEKLLEAAAELSVDDSFRKKRQAFHDWRRKVAAEGATGKAALEEMSALVAEYNDCIMRSGLRTKVLNVFTIVGMAASIASSFAIPAAGIVSAFLAVGRFGADKWMRGQEPSENLRPAAMFCDARKHFGWQ